MRRLPVLVLAAIGFLPAARAAEPLTPTLSPGGRGQGEGGYQPDPRAVQRYGPAYRYPQAGWIVLHIEGEPYERGVQHGRLMAPEIAANIHCFAATRAHKAPKEGWKLVRTIANSLFLRRYDKEYLEEMKGIADGASAAGARFDGREIDIADIVALNSWSEIDTLDDALDADPTGVECLRCAGDRPKAPAPPRPGHCSAFAAVGPATADGKIVFGHITMYDLYQSNFYNVWLDVKSAKGHRVLMQSYPGGIQSGMDYYLNDAGILCLETTIDQTRFDPTGLAAASRVRKALQYADSIDAAVAILKEHNNGLYSDEWMLADVKTNEIALFVLGTHKSKLYRSSKNEWIGGAEGFYWGCNNAKDLDVRLETIDDVKSGRPESAVFHPSARDRKWLELYDRHKGKIDVDFGKLAFTTPPIAAYDSGDAKVTTSDMAKELKTWALFGPPLGRTLKPTEDERDKYPDIHPLVGNPWTVLQPAAPADVKPSGPAVADLYDPEDGDELAAGAKEERETPETKAAWHGTLIPRTDGDVWLASAFRDYERIAALDAAFRRRAKGELTGADRDDLAVELYDARAHYELGARARPERVALKDAKADLRQGDWYRVASGKGVLLLNDLRNVLGEEKFAALMEQFGADHGGEPTSAADFEKAALAVPDVDAAAVKSLLESWTAKPGLPRYRLGKVSMEAADGGGYRLTIPLHVEGGACDRPVDVAVETEDGEVVERVTAPSSADSVVHITVQEKPVRVVVDRYNLASKANGGAFSVLTFKEEPEQALIVYGTADEGGVNREAAEALQQAIRAGGSNVTVPIKTDREVTEDDLKTHHLLLIGRPECNRIAARFAAELPLSFGPRSFVVRGKAYAHPDSAVLAAAENPLNRRFSLVAIAGLGAGATLRAAPLLMDQSAAEVVVLPAGGRPTRSLTVSAPELVYEFPAEGDKTGK